MSLSEFFHLLVSAQHASDAIDRFDLRSGDEESVKQFSQLSAEQDRACITLIEYVQAHGEEIKAMLISNATETF